MLTLNMFAQYIQFGFRFTLGLLKIKGSIYFTTLPDHFNGIQQTVIDYHKTLKVIQ